MALPPRETLSANDLALEPTTSAAAQETTKRARGLTLGSGIVEAVTGPRLRSQRSFRSLASRAFDERPSKRPFLDLASAGRSSSFGRINGRRTSQATESTLPRTHSFNFAMGVDPKKSPERSIDPKEIIRVVKDAEAGAQEQTVGLATAMASPVEMTPLSRTVSREAPLPNEAGAAGAPRADTLPPAVLRSNSRLLQSKPAAGPESGQWSNANTDVRSLGDFALDHLFTAFLAQAEVKINDWSSTSRSNAEVGIDEICGVGVDTSFDQLLSAIGHVARAKPNPLLERVVEWRDSFNKAGVMRRMEVSPITNIANGDGDNMANRSTNSVLIPAGGEVSMADSETLIAGKRSSVAAYLFCRVLIDVLRQTTFHAVGTTMINRLLVITYDHQLRSITHQVFERFQLKRAQWLIVTQTLGELAVLDFDAVSSKFLADLKMFHKDLSIKSSAKTPANRVTEAEAVHLLRSMRVLRLQNDNEKIWKRSCIFMRTIAELFTFVHGQAVKTAYCKLIHAILLPLGDKIFTNFEDPDWKQAVGTLFSRLSHLIDKLNVNVFAQLAEKQTDKKKAAADKRSKYWTVAFPAQSILACVSPQDVFVRHWQQFLEKKQLDKMLRERHHRPHALKATCRMLWSYLQRTTDRPEVVAESLDTLARLVFFSGRVYSLSSEPAIAEPLLYLLRIIGFKNEDVCFKTVLFPLLNYDLLYEREAKDLKVDQIDTDKTVIGIRAFLAVLSDLELRAAPAFPMRFDDERYDDSPAGQLHLTQTSRFRSHARRPISLKSGLTSKPISTIGLSASTKQYFSAFCDLLVKVAVICDSALGGQAHTDEPMSSYNSSAKQTPLADALGFHRREDTASGNEEHPILNDLIRVTVLALPRCLSGHSPHSFLNLICTGTAHPDPDVSSACAGSLNSIGRQGFGRLVSERFSNFLTTLDDRIFTQLVEGTVRSSSVLESALQLYVELIRNWLRELDKVDQDHVRSASGDSVTQSMTKSDAGTWTQIDRIECQGLFFLSSPSARVRGYACDLLDLVIEFDTTLKMENTRITNVLRDTSIIAEKLRDELLSSWERSALEKGLRRNSPRGAITDLCCHNGDQEGTLWQKLYPCVIRASAESCPVAVTQTRESICKRLSSMHAVIIDIEERHKDRLHAPAIDGLNNRASRKPTSVVTGTTIMQWKLYLVFVCITLTRTDIPSPSTQAQISHARTSSKSSQGQPNTINTAAELFTKVVPMLNAFDSSVRAATVAGLGSINKNLYKSLLECLEAAGRPSTEEARKQVGNHVRAASSPQRSPFSGQYVMEFVQVYKLTTHFLQDPDIRNDEWILAHLAKYTRDISMFLRKANSGDHQRLRISYCGLIEGFYIGINRGAEAERWMAFQTRRAAFTLMEEWCDLSTGRDQSGHDSDRASRYINPDLASGQPAALWAHERSQLRNAAQNAMATLSAGPVRSVGGNTLQEFNVLRMLTWVDNMLKTESDKTHTTARRALKNIITNNISFPVLLEFVIERLYLAPTAKGLESYVEVISEVLMAGEAPAIPFWKVLSALLFILGSDRSTVRMKSARLLRFFDEMQRRGSKLQDLEISISDNTTAVNKKAHFEISQRLALQHSEHAFHVFSEFSKHFPQLDADHRRSIVLSLLPWIKTVELQLDPTGGITASSYMLLVNLLHLTISYQNTLHHEIQALWQALATGPHAGNVKLILDFIIDLILDRRDAMLVQVAKHIVVFLSSTPAGQKVIESLLLEVNPRTMWEEKGRDVRQPAGIDQFPFLASLAPASPMASPVSGRDGFSNMSLGHLCLILLVDLIVAPINLAVDRTTLLLHAVLILWDHRMEVVQDQAREMLVHLIHELVLSKLHEDHNHSQMQSVEDFITLIRHRDSRVIWTYEDNNGRGSDFALVEPMTFVIKEVVRIFSMTYPGMEEAWGRVTMNWATLCPVRHLACRSLQIYRCLVKPLNAGIIADLLSRLGASVGDETVITQTYTMDLLRTLRTIIPSITPEHRQLIAPLFWTIWTCLGSVNELEFMESMEMLHALLGVINLADAEELKALNDNKPSEVDLSSDSLISLVMQGCRSALAIDKCLSILRQLVKIPSTPLVGNGEGLHFTILAHLPLLCHSFHEDRRAPQVLDSAHVLINAAEAQQYDLIAKTLRAYISSEIKNSRDLLIRMLEALGFYFFPKLEVASLKFLMGLLTNSQHWFKSEVLQMLEILLANMDLHKHKIIDQGADLVSPLLRLLQTDLAIPALKILDHFTSIPGTKLNLQQLEMSMTTASSSQERKLYEKTQSLYGIPESSGWSIPMPAIRRESLRRDMLAIHDAFAGDVPNGTLSPGIEFYKEDRLFGSYFPERTITMTSEEAHLAETNVSELVDKLGALDDFFDEDDDTDATEAGSGSPYHPPHLHHNRGHSHHSHSGYIRHGAYDSFSNSNSNSSAQSSFRLNSSFGSARRPRDPVVMSPSAFSASPALLASRPDLQPRSMTSPPTNSNCAPSHHSTGSTLHEETSEVFSEDDATSGGRPSTSDGSFVLESGRNSSRHRSGFGQGVRSGFKRLTTRGERHRARMEKEREESPEVPKVPEMYRAGAR